MTVIKADFILIAVIVVIFIKTVSYGAWEHKNNNTAGAVSVIIIALSALAVIYRFF